MQLVFSGRSAAAAYREAYDASHWTPGACRTEATRLLKNPSIAPLIGALRSRAASRIEEAAERHAITQERIAEGLARLAFSDITDVVQWDAKGNITITPAEEMTASQRFSIVEVSQTPHGRKFKLADKSRALMDLARMKGWIDNDPRDVVPVSPVDEEKRQAVRRAIFEELKRLAKPEPLTIEADPAKSKG